jgi:hypothetical protein
VTRLKYDFVAGHTADDPLTLGATTFNSNDLEDFPDVVSPDIAVCSFDPNSQNGDPEIVYITDHVFGASTATILRGQEGTTARAHPVNTRWVHAPTVVDFSTIYDINAQRGALSNVDLVDATVSNKSGIRINQSGSITSTPTTTDPSVRTGSAILTVINYSIDAANVTWHAPTPSRGPKAVHQIEGTITINNTIGDGGLGIAGQNFLIYLSNFTGSSVHNKLWLDQRSDVLGQPRKTIYL